MKVSFTTTAMRRPELLQATYESFQKNLMNINFKECSLHLNIDPAPSDGRNVDEIIKIAESFFKTVKVRIPDECNFSTAVKWLFSETNGDVLFHLEDDWELLFPVDMKKLKRILIENEKINQIRLRKPAKEGSLRKYGLSPCLIRRIFYKKVANDLDEKVNPERQLSWPCYGNERGKGKKVVVWPGFIVVVDTGQEWRDKRNIIKENDFLRWRM